MKKYFSLITLCVFAIFLLVSCSKTAGNADAENIFDENNQALSESANSGKGKGEVIQTVVGDLGADLTNLTFCSAKTVPICAGQTINVGEVAVQTAINGKTYVTYTLKNNWYFKEIHLYCGDADEIPCSGGGNASPGQFPFAKVFTAPYTVQKYSFVIDGLGPEYAVAAHASLAKINPNGTILQEETGWGDGCNGAKINQDGGAWGTFMNYVGSGCTITAAMTEPVNICSNSVDTYYWVNPNNPNALTWRESATVAGYTYTELEARAIANCSSDADAKYVFMRASTLKLSKTEYQKSPILSSAMSTIEEWLKTKGKLSPANLPTGNSTVRNAGSIIESWIASHLCAIE